MDYKKASDQTVFQAREKIKKNFGQNIYELIDQYPLFACPQTMLRVNKNFELLKRSLKIPGDIFEFGTWRGATAIFFAKILDEIEPQSNRKIFVFDNFSGLPEPTSTNRAGCLIEIPSRSTVFHPEAAESNKISTK